MDENLLSEFDAALLVGMSPVFLRWCTSYAPKTDGVKLPFKQEDNVYYFNKQELLAFDAHLKAPWAKPAKSQRPNLPTGIELEIKSEAWFRCPICNTNLGEIAHIDPVSTHMDNHPHNLIFLCPNHHTEYDYGYRTKNITKEEVVHFKKSLQIFQRTLWSLQKNTVESYLSLIATIGRVREIEAQVKNIPAGEFDKLFTKIVDKIEETKKRSPDTKVLDEVLASVKIETTSTAREKVEQYYHTRDPYIERLKKSNLIKECPLCETRGYTKDFETCPVCRGEGYIDFNREPDLSLYELEECPLCEGDGRTNFFDICPPCGGEGRLTKELIETIDFSKFELVDCPLCDGDGRTNYYDPCPPCQGEGKVTREQLDITDFDKYDLTECPFCKGNGRTRNFDPCPVCGGEGEISHDQAAKVDLAKYAMVQCTLCHGRGSTADFETCPVCGGEGEITEEQAERVDLNRYEVLRCPACKGYGTITGDRTCPICRGHGQLTREQLDRSGYDD